MAQFKKLAEAVFKKRADASRWPYLVPALISSLFVGHAYEDGGLSSAFLYIGIIAISVITALRPNVFVWFILLILFLTYGLIVLFSTSDILPLKERIIFASLGLVPSIVLYVY